MKLSIRLKNKKSLGASAVEYALALAVITTLVIAGGRHLGLDLHTVMTGTGQTIETLGSNESGNSSSNSSKNTDTTHSPPENEVAVVGIITRAGKWIWDGGKWVLKKVKPKKALTASQQRAIKSLEKQIKEHQKKLDDF